MRRQGLAYVLVLVLVALVTGVLAHFGSWARQVAACRVLQREGAYLAYCAHPLYASYEHEAYGMGFEPRAVSALQRAQVLFLGNSRLQFAFSTPQVDRFFGDRGIPYHLLGFGYGESSRFPRFLLERYRPAPKLVVINADPFFVPVLSPAAAPMFPQRWATRVDAAEKWMFSRLQAVICQLPQLCSNTQPTTYRDARTGQWLWHDVLLPADAVATSITAQKASTWSDAMLADWQREADTFLPLLPVPRECILLTGVPTTQVDAEGMATALGRRLGLPVVLPNLDGLHTVDDSHLAAASAGRWSAALLRAAEPLIQRCLAMPAQRQEPHS